MFSLTLAQGNLPRLATARVMAGLMWPPDTPPATSMPSATPTPRAQLTVRALPWLWRERTDWAVEADPNTTSRKVPDSQRHVEVLRK